MDHLTEPEPPRGPALPVAPGITRIVAANPGPMTYHGTNTYLVEEADGIVVIDPGPADPAHLGAILAAAGGQVTRILLTHTHADHFGNLAPLRAATGATVFAHAPEAAPDRAPADGEAIGGLRAVHTPGHALDHLCFAAAGGLLFTGDHVMGWSTSVVPPRPRGDMAAYIASLERLLTRDDRCYLPGHGPAIRDPHSHVASLISRRIAREAAILRTLERGPATAAGISARLYPRIAPALRGAAEANVRAHLAKLADEGRITEAGGAWHPAA